MTLLNTTALEDALLGLFVEARATHTGASLLLTDLQEGWRHLKLREDDLEQGLRSLLEAGMVQCFTTEDGHTVQLTEIGAEYIDRVSLAGIKTWANQKLLNRNINRLRKGNAPDDVDPTQPPSRRLSDRFMGDTLEPMLARSIV